MENYSELASKYVISPDGCRTLCRTGGLLMLVDGLCGLVVIALAILSITTSEWVFCIGMIGLCFIVFLLRSDREWVSPQLRFLLLFSNKPTRQEIQYVLDWAKEAQHDSRFCKNYPDTESFDEKVRVICLLIFGNRAFYKTAFLRRDETLRAMNIFFPRVEEPEEKFEVSVMGPSVQHKPKRQFGRAYILTIFALLLTGGLLFFHYSKKNEISTAGIEYYNLSYVYISQGPSAKCFHADKNCMGLRNSKQILKVKLKKAETEYNRTPCRFCCKTSASEDPLYENFGD